MRVELHVPVHVRCFYRVYVPHNLQIYTVSKICCASLKLENCKPISNLRSQVYMISKLHCSKLEIAKLRSGISKVDMYSNMKRTCTFPSIKKLVCRILNPKYKSVTLNTNCAIINVGKTLILELPRKTNGCLVECIMLLTLIFLPKLEVQCL